MIDYIIFFGLFSLAFLSFILFSYKAKKSGFTEYSYYNSQLRKCESPIESKLYRSIGHSYPIATQYSVGKYRLDMAIPSRKIAIECDGKAYHSSPSQKAHDRRRDAYLRSRGWKVIRISGSQIHNNINKAVIRIDKAMR